VAHDEKPVSGYRASATLHFRADSVGAYRIVLAVYDSAGAKDTRTIQIWARDVIPPSVRVLGVKDVNVPGDNYELNAATVFYKREGGDWRQGETYPMHGMEYEVDAGIPVFEPGDYNIMIVVTDTSGNKATAYTSARAVDEIPPVITVVAPSEVNQGEPMHFSVDVTDNYKIRSVSVAVDGNVIYSNDRVDSNYWSRDFVYVFPHASPHSISVLASDGFNNTAAQTKPVEVYVVDENAPVIDLNAWYDANTVSILWRIRATDPHLADVNYYLNGQYLGSCDVAGGIAECNGSYEINAPDTYIFSVVAVDSY